ncbi:UbiA prenyltransferase family-domain-containing protein [Suillus paluster]|uniref:UbiA prenyltransferase family-domain-containing protein n=1 Tax=Suillus paluster TaxID=48578 RepID=UPI001B8717FD|nr:UbiA prenyltransferase family-domain-containing protein [Suillus paluster]KAG1732896.1 UbiA prenyltransferase family-domain-containing protein [Suillus paluster]
MLSQALDSGRRISGHIMTLFLFTKSDILTTLLPITLFALAAAPHLHATRIPDTIIWIWMHLLKFDISNQIQDPDEDKRNKPDRPLPAGRITPQNAADLRWLLVPVCLFFSATSYGRQTLAASVCFEAFSIWYNEFGGNKTGLSKNLLTAIGYTCLEVGATIVAGSSPRIDSISARAMVFSCAVFATTLHAQDFKDEEGDRFTGRRTLVTLFPTFARMSMMIGVPPLVILPQQALESYGMVVGGRFVIYRTTKC